MWSEMTEKYEQLAAMGREREELEAMKTAKLREVAELEQQIKAIDGRAYELAGDLKVPSTKLGGQARSASLAGRAELAARRKRVLDFLESNPTKPYTSEDIASALGLRTRDVGHTMRALSRRKEVLVTREPGRLGTFQALPGKLAASG